MKWLLVVLLLLAGEPDSITIPTSYGRAFLESGERTLRTKQEEFLCLQGVKRGNHYRIEAVVRPKQYTENKNFVRIDSLGAIWFGTVYRNFHIPCVAGRTIMDLHTHPVSGLFPSSIDLNAWRTDPYNLHAIMSGDKMVVYYRDGDNFRPLMASRVRFSND